ncbi:MAG: molybdopterin-dependent oxidoreductase [ANME-2 cluster archaeon]|nr:molybdopterin-dependent oxidoreductase [ANME-2 cluster archaeon]
MKQFKDVTSKDITRRGFLKLTAATGGAVVAGSALLDPAMAGSECIDCHKIAGAPARKQPHKWIPTVCNMCGGQTGVLADVMTVENEKVVLKVVPNLHNPMGVSNVSEDFEEHKNEGAALCPRGNASIMDLYDHDRLSKPMKRTNPVKGKGIDPGWKEITWTEAYELISTKLSELKENGEAHKLVWFSDDDNFVHIQQDFCNLYGTPNYHNQSNLYDAVRRAAFKSMVGHQRPLTDNVDTKFILLFGTNPLSAVKWGYVPQTMIRGIQHGAQMVVVDPYHSFTASKAHEWVPIKPGTDGALALALGHVIIKLGLYDNDFIDHWTVGFDEYADYVRNKSPEWAESITGIPAGTIERLGRELGNTRPVIIDAWSGVTQHSNGFQTMRAIVALTGLLGQFDVRGGLVLPDMSGNVHQEVKYTPSKYSRLDGGTDKYPFAHESGVIVETLNTMQKGTGPYQPKVGVVMHQNLVMSVPGTENVIEAMKSLEFLAVVDTHMSETAELADLVLPGTHYLERYDLVNNWTTWPSVSLRQPVIEPRFGQPVEYEFIIELGRRLGLRETDGNLFFNNLVYEEYLSRELENGAPGITLEELKELPGATWTDPEGTKFKKYDKIIRLSGSSDVDENGVVHDKDGKPIGVMIWDRYHAGFETPTRKFELYSGTLGNTKDANGDPIPPIPEYKAADIKPDYEYPLYLINWKEVSHTGVRTQNNIWLDELKHSNYLAIHPETAERLNIRTGDPVWIETKNVKDKGTALLTDRIHPEVVGMQHGFGHWNMGEVANGNGTNDYQFYNTAADPVSGNALANEMIVKVYRA